MGFPLPPITQYRHGAEIINHVERADEIVRSNPYATIYGRRRLNDYVGSPHWGPWELLVWEIRAEDVAP